MKFKSKLLLLVMLPVLLLGAFIAVMGQTVVRRALLQEIEQQLRGTAAAALAAYDQNSGDYMRTANGDIWKGSYNVSLSGKLVDGIKAGSGFDITIFYGNERIMTSVVDGDGRRVLGSPAGDTVAERVLQKGEEYFSDAVSLNGVMSYGYYLPVYQNGAEQSDAPIGMLCAAVARDTKDSVIDGIVLIMAGLSVAVAVVCILVAMLASARMMRPVQKLQTAAEEMADGSLTADIDIERKDEVGELAKSFQRIVNQQRQYAAYINELALVLEQIGRRDLVFDLKQDYSGGFQKLKDSMDQIQESLSRAIFSIQSASEDVDLNSNRLSAGAQGLARGSAQQMGMISQLADSIESLTNMAGTEAGHAEKTNKQMEKIGTKVQENNCQMQQMMAAMSNIQQHSASIEKIVKASEDIAFQTNILALNAAVEAARAGSAGKGFAVVADEVRNLASKSAASAKEIAALIQDSISAVQEGVALAGSTAESLQQVTEEVGNVVKDIEHSTLFYRDAAHKMSGISEDMNEIAAEMQVSSATAQESAASAQDLTGQASTMKEMVSTFHLDQKYKK